MRAEHDVRPLGHLVDVVDEDRAALLELAHDVHVVHDLLAHVDGSPEVLERLLDRDHRAVDAGAVPARGGEQHPLLSGNGTIDETPANRGDAGRGQDDRAVRDAGHPPSLRSAPGHGWEAGGLG
jgi:hypothetical protein